MKKRMYCFFAAILVSSLLVGSWGAYLKYEKFRDLEIETEESIFSLPFVMMSDAELKFVVSTRIAEQNAPTVPTEIQIPAETVPSVTVPPATEDTLPPETEPVETEPVYVPVDESWFEDALFIGESRTMGLKSMARIEGADYFCAASLTVYGVLDVRCADDHFWTQNLDSLLSSKTYGKIYIHLGINELVGDLDNMIKQYRNVIQFIREKQPDAHIILQAALSVSRSYAKNPTFAVENIRDLNARIENLAMEEGVLFIDMNPAFCDEEGYLLPELTYDGCHLFATGCEQWKQWLIENAGWLGIP